MLNVTLLSSVAKNALIGAVASKVLDSFISTKVNSKIEHNKWLRKTKLDLYADLINEVLSLDEKNFEEKENAIRKNISKIILLLNNKNITISLENYLNILNEYKNNAISTKQFNKSNDLFILYLKKNLKI